MAKAPLLSEPLLRTCRKSLCDRSAVPANAVCLNSRRFAARRAFLGAALTLALTLALALIASADFAAAADDPYVPLATLSPGVTNYVRRSEIDVVFDQNPSQCGLILKNARLIRAHSSCASIIAALQRDDFAIFTNQFGKVFLVPSIVSNLAGTNNGGCRLSFKNGRHVSVNESCARVHDSVNSN